MPDESAPDSTNGADANLTLSAAILAPINSLFEVQAHSARAFLNFILQLGFKHRMTEEDLDFELKRRMDERSLDDETEGEFEAIRGMIYDQVRYDNLKRIKSRTDEEEQEMNILREHLHKNGRLEDVHVIQFKYLDGEGNEHLISIPALALVPVKPLSITSASFDFAMSVNSEYEDYRQQQKGREGEEVRPWFFIKPKRFRGKIESEERVKNNASIRVHVEIESSPIPQGLSNLLTSLTQSGRIVE